MAFTVSSTWRTTCPLCRIFSSSAPDLQTIAMLNCPEDLCRNFLRHLVAIDFPQLSLTAVIINQGKRLMLVSLQALGDDFLGIILARRQLRTINIASVGDARRLRVNVVDPSAGGTSTAPRQATQQLIIPNRKIH